MQALFSQYDLSQLLKNQFEALTKAVQSYDGERLLNTSAEDLAAYFGQKHTLDPLVLHFDQLVVDVGEAQVDVSRDQSRYIRNRSQPFYITGTRVTVEIPFTGDKDFLFCQGSTFSSAPPYAHVGQNTISLTISAVDPDEDRTRQEIDKWTSSLKRHLGWISPDIDGWNQDVESKARQQIEFRRKKLLETKRFGANLGYPLKKRSGQPNSFSAPEVRKKILPQPPKASTEPFQPEPALSLDHYEHILQIMVDTATMLERSPATFGHMDEESLRDVFLVPLNSQYEGQATGETFNVSGKTDITVRSGNKCVFIAECKIWSGPKGLGSAVDQLLGYLTWRDTKAAILIFNKAVSISTVLQKITTTIQRHKNYKRTIELSREGQYRFVLGSINDMNREITLTVLVFDIPQPNSTAG